MHPDGSMSHGCKAQRSDPFWGEGSKRGVGRSVQQSRHGGPWSTTPGHLPGAGLPFFTPGLEAASGSSSLSDPSRGALLLPGGWEGGRVSLSVRP